MLVFVIIAIIVVGIKIYYDVYRANVLETREKTEILTFANGKKIYVRAKVWGVAGTHEQIVLSQSNNNVPNKTDDYIFYTSEVFYKVGNDNAVTVYAIESSISEPANKIPNVTVKGLKIADEARDYNINYKKYGLERISVYE